MTILTISEINDALAWLFTLGLCECGIFIVHALYYVRYLGLDQSNAYVIATSAEGMIGAIAVYYSFFMSALIGWKMRGGVGE